MYYLILNVFLLVLFSWSSPAYSQTPLDTAISQLNPCANSCISRFAAAIKCEATDFACQCAHPDAINGLDKTGGCLFRECGHSNATDVRSSFSKICDLEAASSQVASELPTSTQAASTPSATPVSLTPVTTTDNTPTPTPTSSPSPTATIIPTFPPTTPTLVITSSTNETPALPTSQTTQSELPASTIPTTESLPTNSPAPAPTTPIPQSTPPPAQTPQSVSTPPAFTPPPGIATSSSTPFILSIQSSAFPASAISPITSQASPITESNPTVQSSSQPPSTKNKRLSSGAVAGIAILALASIAAILSLAFIQLRRRRRKSYITDRQLEEKLRPPTEAASPSSRDGSFSSPLDSSSKWLPWDIRRPKTQTSIMTGQDINSQPQPEPSRPKSRGKNSEENIRASEAPSSFPMLATGIPQGVNTGSPPLSGRPGTSGSGTGQPLKSAMKKTRDRPKSRPLILRDGENGAFNFGLDPLGSNPRSPR